MPSSLDSITTLSGVQYENLKQCNPNMKGNITDKHSTRFILDLGLEKEPDFNSSFK